MRRSAIILYVVLVLALSWAIQILAISVLGLNSGITRLLFVVVMWSPTVVAIAFIAQNQAARGELRWRLGLLRYYPIGIAAETAIAFGVLGLFLVLGPAASGWFRFDPSGVFISGGPWVFGRGLQGWPLYIVNVGATAIVYSAMGLVATVGEEFAWRGFLQGHLVRRLGAVRGILMVSAVWWAWHLPGLIAGYNFPETPLLGAFVLFPLQMIGASFFFGWLTIRSGSFWPAALAHGAVNSIQQGVMDDLHFEGPTLYIHVARTAGILLVGLLSCKALLAPLDGSVAPAWTEDGGKDL